MPLDHLFCMYTSFLWARIIHGRVILRSVPTVHFMFWT